MDNSINSATANQYDPRLAELEKEKSETNWQTANHAIGYKVNVGSIGLFGSTNPTLRERVAQNLDRARQEARRTDALQELQYLLEKNPDVARILELLESAQVLRA